jgi:Ca2+-binding EF-hand superfamily protein
LNFIASRVDEREVKFAREAFLEMDVNKDGCLSMEEMKKGLGDWIPKD